MIKINIGLLEKESLELEGSEPASFLDVETTSELEINSPLKYKLSVHLTSGGALVQGSLTYDIIGMCGRCLMEFDETIELPKISMWFELPNTEELDISDDIREEALLALPSNMLCDPNCAGLCPHCGIDLNDEECDCEDPAPPEEESPWGALDNLKI